MIEYFITQHDDGTYQIAKFTGGSEPVAVYTISNQGKDCDCPAGSHRGKCKHIKMAKEWTWGFYYIGDRLVPMPDSFDHENVIDTDPPGTK